MNGMKCVVGKKLGDIARREGSLESPAKGEQVRWPFVSRPVGTALQRGCGEGGSGGSQSARPCLSWGCHAGSEGPPLRGCPTQSSFAMCYSLLVHARFGKIIRNIGFPH